MPKAAKPLVGLIMGSQSDWPTLRPASEILTALGVAHESRIVSAHRTPDRMSAYAKRAGGRGLKVIIAGAGGSAHLPGMTASETTLPVIAIPIKRENHGHEAFWSNIKMPPGAAWAAKIGNMAR